MVKYDNMNNIIELRRKSIMLCYCKKCGRMVQRTSKNLEKPCDYCQNITKPVPDAFLDSKSKLFIKDELKQQFIDEYIKSSPEFDQYLFDHRDEDLNNRRMENEAKLEHGKAVLEGRNKGNKYGVECPYCHATNVSRIGFINRAVSTGLLGLASSKIGKTYKCNNCGSTW